MNADLGVEGMTEPEPAQSGLGPSQTLARCKMARLGLARFANEPEKQARLELPSGSVQLDQARQPAGKL
jgi:hypothetical protein